MNPKEMFEIMGSNDTIRVVKIPMCSIENTLYDLKQYMNNYTMSEILSSCLQVNNGDITAYLLVREHYPLNYVSDWRYNEERLDQVLKQWLDNREYNKKTPTEEELKGVNGFLFYLKVNEWAIIKDKHIRIHDSLHRTKIEDDE